jgi:hypothetical protein
MNDVWQLDFPFCSDALIYLPYYFSSPETSARFAVVPAQTRLSTLKFHVLFVLLASIVAHW